MLDTVQSRDPSPDEAAAIDRLQQRSTNQWTSAYGDSNAGQSGSTDDPASRFISALDAEVKPVEETKEASIDDPISTWETSAPAFTPPPPSNWSYGARSDEPIDADIVEESDTEDDQPGESVWEAPATWTSVESTDDSADDDEIIDVAGFTDDGDDEVDYLSGDENIEVSGNVAASLPPDEARDKAIALADELRRTIRMMSSGGESDHGAAIMALTEASLGVGDFSDVRGVLVDVKNDPRDIQALGSLAGKIERLETLLDEHSSLAHAIEEAIKELNG